MNNEKIAQLIEKAEKLTDAGKPKESNLLIGEILGDHQDEISPEENATLDIFIARNFFKMGNCFWVIVIEVGIHSQAEIKKEFETTVMGVHF